MADIIQITEKDNVAVALADLSEGCALSAGGRDITTTRAVSRGHKIAVKPIQKGEAVIKYGFSIGSATEDIEAGDWVHTHNMKTGLSGEESYTYQPDFPGVNVSEGETFLGYQRKDGKVGIRNEIWIIPTVGCVNDVAKKIAADNQDLIEGDAIDGLYAFTHPFGCSQTGADHAQTRKLLAALAKHPNAAAVLVLSLGCENLTHDQFVEELGDFDPDRIKFLTCQEVSDEFSEARKLLKQCADFAGAFRRQPLPVGELIIGMKCGASDGLSGITANPAVGRFSDLLIQKGGSTVLTEVPEMFGAEGMLMNRCVNQEVFEKSVNMINGFKEYFIRHGEVVYENPSPGNKAGGITTLEDKSCGCVQKGGTMPIMDVIGYGEQVRCKGLNMLYGPGNDLVSSTALTAAGAHMVLFTTGRGTPFGAPAPTLKIASNSAIAEKKAGWIDFNAGTAAEGESLDAAGKRLYDLVIRTAEGRKAKNEELGFRDISIFKDGVTL